MPLTHIVLVNWNGMADSIECVESLLRLDESDFAVTVCDNGSSDGSIAEFKNWLKRPEGVDFTTPPWHGLPTQRRYPLTGEIIRRDFVENPVTARVTLVEAGENLGFAGGNNLGVRRALADPECGYIWLLNNDTIVTPSALSELIALMNAEKGIAICGSTLLFYHDPQIVQGLGGRFWTWRGRGSHLGFMRTVTDLPPRAEIESQMTYVMGASMFVRRNVFERVGGLSEEYFLYYEEQDLAKYLRVSERQAWAPSSIVFHKEGGSIGTSSVRAPSRTSIYYLTVNMFRYYWKHHRFIMFVPAVRFIRDILRNVAKGEKKVVAVALRAINDFFTGKYHKGPV